MKVIAKDIKMIAGFTEDGTPTPLRFKIRSLFRFSFANIIYGILE